MDSRLRLLTIACAVVLFAGVVSAFTVDGDDGELASADAPTSTTAGDDVATDGSTTSTTEATDESTTTEAESSSTTEAASSSTTAAPTTAAPTTQAIPERKPTTPGMYTYDVTGTSSAGPIDGESVLTVSQVDGQGRQTQQQKGEEGESTTTYRYAAEGMYLESMRMVQGPATLTLSATSPFLILPADAQAGTVTTGQLKGDGLTADVTFTVLEVGTGTSRARIEADITGRTFGCDVAGTMSSTITARSTDQLPIDSHSVNNLKLSGVGCLAPGTMSSDIRSVLQQ